MGALTDSLKSLATVPGDIGSAFSEGGSVIYKDTGLEYAFDAIYRANEAIRNNSPLAEAEQALQEAQRTVAALGDDTDIKVAKAFDDLMFQAKRHGVAGFVGMSRLDPAASSKAVALVDQREKNRLAQEAGDALGKASAEMDTAVRGDEVWNLDESFERSAREALLEKDSAVAKELVGSSLNSVASRRQRGVEPGSTEEPLMSVASPEDLQTVASEPTHTPDRAVFEPEDLSTQAAPEDLQPRPENVSVKLKTKSAGRLSGSGDLSLSGKRTVETEPSTSTQTPTPIYVSGRSGDEVRTDFLAEMDEYDAVESDRLKSLNTLMSFAKGRAVPTIKQGAVGLVKGSQQDLSHHAASVMGNVLQGLKDAAGIWAAKYTKETTKPTMEKPIAFETTTVKEGGKQTIRDYDAFTDQEQAELAFRQRVAADKANKPPADKTVGLNLRWGDSYLDFKDNLDDVGTFNARATDWFQAPGNVKKEASRYAARYLANSDTWTQLANKRDPNEKLAAMRNHLDAAVVSKVTSDLEKVGLKDGTSPAVRERVFREAQEGIVERFKSKDIETILRPKLGVDPRISWDSFVDDFGYPTGAR